MCTRVRRGVRDEIQQGKYGIPIVKWDKCNRSEFPEKQLPDSLSKNVMNVTFLGSQDYVTIRNILKQKHITYRGGGSAGATGA